jgi:hypothetical protein
VNLLRSRRPDPSTWTSDQIRSLVVAAYVGDYSEGLREPYYGQSEFTLPGYNDGRAAVVFHLPEKMMPRRVLREFHKQRGGPWLPYRWYALVWCQTNIDYALMGDDTAWDVIRPGNSFGDPNAARGEAEEWLRAAGEEIRPVAWDSLPWVAQSFATAAVRRGF